MRGEGRGRGGWRGEGGREGCTNDDVILVRAHTHTHTHTHTQRVSATSQLIDQRVVESFSEEMKQCALLTGHVVHGLVIEGGKRAVQLFHLQENAE